jgi:hypothetical protein
MDIMYTNKQTNKRSHMNFFHTPNGKCFEAFLGEKIRYFGYTKNLACFLCVKNRVILLPTDLW